MRKLRFVLLAFVGASVGAVHAANFASSIIEYTPGTGYATEFGTGLGYTNTPAALGAPAVTNEIGSITPFNSPYARAELLSLGTGGSLTVGFSAPIANDPLNPFGLDFLIFGSAAFIDVDFPNGRTDATASMFSQNEGANPGATRVWVSADNLNYFELDPTRAPVVDGLFPTDGSGNPSVPADPSLRNSGALTNKTLAELRGLYNGSAGGTGYDLAWAVDTNGATVSLPAINFVRIDVLQNRSEIDAIGAVVAVPEPGAWALLAVGAALFGIGHRSRR